MEYSFSREELINAIEYLDQHPEEFKGRESSTYDLVYDDKKYPPILVLSKANELKGDKELLLKDFKNSVEVPFKILRDKGFLINPKNLNRKEEFKKWISKELANKSGAGPAYITSLEWLSERFFQVGKISKRSIFEIDDIKLLKDLHEETKLIQRDKTSYIYNNDAPSYGEKYFYSASLNKYIEFLKKNDYTQSNTDIENVETTSIRFDFNKFSDSLRNSNLQFNDKLVQRFVASLLTKPFVILTGLAGSGKTKLAQSFIQWICESKEQYKLVAVGADWINREPLLGYPNGLNSKDYVTPDNEVLELMLTASKIENQDKPYFLVLDEMNLSHVERYFADFLSIMESEDSIKLYTGAERKSTNDTEIPQTISWPKNLFIIGTVNIDETTYMFSPKVLDRANVIEFKLDEDDLKSFLAEPKKVDLSQLTSEGAAMASSFITLSKQNDTASNEVLNETLVEFFKELKMIGAEFGYRTAFEIHLLFAQFSKIDSSLSDEDKIDFAVMQKLLPKLHGSRSKIVKSLEALIRLCLKDATEFNLSKLDDLEENQIKYNVSFDKLKRMYANALSNGFTSYAEA
ncbi:hypothetical protein OBK30_02300 [Empedobacter falsenii]